jgi:hypothetical protein
VVVTGTVEDVAAGFEFEQAVALGHLRSVLLHGCSTVFFDYFCSSGWWADAPHTGRWPEYLHVNTHFTNRPGLSAPALKKRADCCAEFPDLSV